MPKLERPTYLMAKFLLGIMIWWLNHVQCWPCGGDMCQCWQHRRCLLAAGMCWRDLEGVNWTFAALCSVHAYPFDWTMNHSFCCNLATFIYVFFFYLQKDFRDLCIPQRIWIEFSWWCRMTREWDTFGGIKISPTLLGSGQEWTCCFVVLPGMLHPLRLRSARAARACGHHPDFGDEKGGFLRKGAIGSISKIVDRRGLFGGLQARYFVYMQCTSWCTHSCCINNFVVLSWQSQEPSSLFCDKPLHTFQSPWHTWEPHALSFLVIFHHFMMFDPFFKNSFCPVEDTFRLPGAEHHAELFDMETLHSTTRWEVPQRLLSACHSCKLF